MFIKLSDYSKIDLQVYLNDAKTNFDNVKKNEWIGVPVKYSPRNESDILKVKLKINAEERNLKMKFFDSYQTPKINLKQLLNLNFNTGKLKYLTQPYNPAFKVTVDANTFFSIPKELPYKSKLYINVKRELLSVNLFDYIYLEKNKAYIIDLGVKKERKKIVIILNHLKLNFIWKKSILKIIHL